MRVWKCKKCGKFCVPRGVNTLVGNPTEFCICTNPEPVKAEEYDRT